MVHLFAAVLSALAFTLAAAGSAFAGPATDTVKAKQSALFALLRQGTPDAQKKMDAIFDDMMDYVAFAEGSLGDAWGARSEGEKAQFTDLLKQIVRRSYQKNLKRMLDYEVVYIGETPADDAVIVSTTAKSATDPVQIGFKLKQKDSAWKVQDIILEGDSTVTKWRADFTRIIKDKGFAGVVEKLKRRLAQNP
jgi:phospholipid transport system substrate-binding protein